MGWIPQNFTEKHSNWHGPQAHSKQCVLTVASTHKKLELNHT